MTTPDYPLAEAHFLDENKYPFIGQNTHEGIVIHETAGDATVEAVEQTFLGSNRSTHYAVGPDSRIWQFIHEVDGAGGNCCPDATHDPWWDPIIAHSNVNGRTNLNVATLSIEHCTADRTSQAPLTSGQLDASFKLVWYLMQKYKLPVTAIHGHNSINATTCPGTYPFDKLFAFINAQGKPQPAPAPDVSISLVLYNRLIQDLADLMSQSQGGDPKNMHAWGRLFLAHLGNMNPNHLTVAFMVGWGHAEGGAFSGIPGMSPNDCFYNMLNTKHTWAGSVDCPGKGKVQRFQRAIDGILANVAAIQDGNYPTLLPSLALDQWGPLGVDGVHPMSDLIAGDLTMWVNGVRSPIDTQYVGNLLVAAKNA